MVRLSNREAVALGLGSFRGRATRVIKKHRNKPTRYDSATVGDKTFQSQWEAQLCAILDDMVRVGEIQTFIDQVTIPLVGMTENGIRRSMRPDFMLIDNNGVAHFWDAKGQTTDKWQLQRDMVWHLHRIDVIPVYKGKPLPQIYEEGDRHERTV